jgi:hypothetical protein
VNERDGVRQTTGSDGTRDLCVAAHGPVRAQPSDQIDGQVGVKYPPGDRDPKREVVRISGGTSRSLSSVSPGAASSTSPIP